MGIFNRKAKVVEEKAPAAEEVKKPAAKKATKKAVKKTAEKAVASGAISVLAARTIIAPLVTEKTASLSESGVYAFHVAPAANRVAVREAFRELYKVTPVKVNIIRVHGKVKRFGKKVSRASDFKKALVTVPSGKRVDIFTV